MGGGDPFQIPSHSLDVKPHTSLFAEMSQFSWVAVPPQEITGISCCMLRFKWQLQSMPENCMHYYLAWLFHNRFPNCQHYLCSLCICVTIQRIQILLKRWCYILFFILPPAIQQKHIARIWIWFLCLPLGHNHNVRPVFIPPPMHISHCSVFNLAVLQLKTWHKHKTKLLPVSYYGQTKNTQDIMELAPHFCRICWSGDSNPHSNFYYFNYTITLIS
jgi:hypothetical protein